MVYKDSLQDLLDSPFLVNCPDVHIIYEQLAKLTSTVREPLTSLYAQQIQQLKEMGLDLGSDEEMAQLLYRNYGDVNKILNMLGYK